MGASGVTTDEALQARLGQRDEHADAASDEDCVDYKPLEVEPTFLSRVSARLPDEVSSLLHWLTYVATNLATVVFQASRFAARSVVAYVRLHPVHTAINVTLIAMIGLLVSTGVAVNQQLIDHKLSADTVDALVEASAYTRSYSLAQLRDRGEREFMRPGAPSWAQRESVQAILEAARESGLSTEHQAVLLATAEVESGLNPMATAATTSACGVFQFIRETGEKFGLKDSDCLDPRLSAQAEIDHYTHNYKRQIEARVRDLNGPEKLLRMFELSFYLHHDGQLSDAPAPELKAVILAGTPFLFRSYNVLRGEQGVRESEPTFGDRLRDERDAVVNALLVMAKRAVGSDVGLTDAEAAAPSEVSQASVLGVSKLESR